MKIQKLSKFSNNFYIMLKNNFIEMLDILRDKNLDFLRPFKTIISKMK